MEKKIKKYVKEVMQYLDLDYKTKNRYKEDLITQINERASQEHLDLVLNDLGNPKELARQYMDDGGYEKQKYFRFEYKSKMKLLGLPLIHICMSERGIRGNIAKGIIAIAPFSFGVVSIGAFSVGLLAFGAICLGLFSFGSIAFGLLLAYGAIAVGLGAVGAVAIGYLARGAVAVGHTVIGIETAGVNVLEGENITNKEVFDFIQTHHPNLKEWIIRLFSFGR